MANGRARPFYKPVLQAAPSVAWVPYNLTAGLQPRSTSGSCRLSVQYTYDLSSAAGTSLRTGWASPAFHARVRRPRADEAGLGAARRPPATPLTMLSVAQRGRNPARVDTAIASPAEVAETPLAIPLAQTDQVRMELRGLPVRRDKVLPVRRDQSLSGEIRNELGPRRCQRLCLHVQDIGVLLRELLLLPDPHPFGRSEDTACSL
jgi:hypothetical protein